MVLRYWLEGLYVETPLRRMFSNGKSRRRRTDESLIQQIELLQPKMMLAAAGVDVDSSPEAEATSGDSAPEAAPDGSSDSVWLVQTGPWWNFASDFNHQTSSLRLMILQAMPLQLLRFLTLQIPCLKLS